MVANDDKATHLNCFHMHLIFEQKYPKPAIGKTPFSISTGCQKLFNRDSFWNGLVAWMIISKFPQAGKRGHFQSSSIALLAPSN